MRITLFLCRAALADKTLRASFAADDTGRYAGTISRSTPPRFAMLRVHADRKILRALRHSGDKCRHSHRSATATHDDGGSAGRADDMRYAIVDISYFDCLLQNAADSRR